MTTIDTAVSVDVSGDRDAAIIKLVTEHGLTLNAATKRYIELRKEQGLHTGIVSRKDDALEMLKDEGTVDLKIWINRLQDELDVSEGAARDYIKAHCEATGASVRSQSSSEAILEWMVATAPCTDDADEWDEFDATLKSHMKALGKSVSNTNEYRKAIRFHRMMINR